MKKLFTLVVISVLASFVLSSCSSTFTKRKYRKGYYVSKNHKPRDTKETVTRHEDKKPVTSVPALVMPELAKAEAAKVPATTENKSASAPVTSKQTTSKNSMSGKKLPALALSDISVKHPVKTIDTAINKYKLNAHDGESDGLSLFWIVILIILILWALGLISGSFGFIINVLLLVALILLILWLLRIL